MSYAEYAKWPLIPLRRYSEASVLAYFLLNNIIISVMYGGSAAPQ